MARRECPMCGEAMQLTERTAVDRVPGTTVSRATKQREWVCPECGHFEEAERGETQDRETP